MERIHADSVSITHRWTPLLSCMNNMRHTRLSCRRFPVAVLMPRQEIWLNFRWSSTCESENNIQPAGARPSGSKALSSSSKAALGTSEVDSTSHAPTAGFPESCQPTGWLGKKSKMLQLTQSEKKQQQETISERVKPLDMVQDHPIRSPTGKVQDKFDTRDCSAGAGFQYSKLICRQLNHLIQNVLIALLVTDAFRSYG